MDMTVPADTPPPTMCAHQIDVARFAPYEIVTCPLVALPGTTSCDAHTPGRLVSSVVFDCIDNDGSCIGPVEYHIDPVPRGSTYPRCERHWALLLIRFENGLRRAEALDLLRAVGDPNDALAEMLASDTDDLVLAARELAALVDRVDRLNIEMSLG